MADEAEERPGAGAASIVGSERLDWACRLKEAQRIEADPEDTEMRAILTKG